MNKRMWTAGTAPVTLLELLSQNLRVALFRKGRRRLRLFACACCRNVWDLLPREADREAVAVNERFADGLVKMGELERARKQVAAGEAEFDREEFGELAPGLQFARAQAHEALKAALQPQALNSARLASHYSTLAAVNYRAEQAPRGWFSEAQTRAAHRDEEGQRCELLRDIFGDPFRPLHHMTFPEVVRGVAEAAYQSQEPEHYLVLADALEEHGQLEQQLGRSWLDPETGQYLPVLHLRRASTGHVKGCHVVDWIRGQP
jgi:hypothetical protein